MSIALLQRKIDQWSRTENPETEPHIKGPLIYNKMVFKSVEKGVFFFSKNINKFQEKKSLNVPHKNFLNKTTLIHVCQRQNKLHACMCKHTHTHTFFFKSSPIFWKIDIHILLNLSCISLHLSIP